MNCPHCNAISKRDGKDRHDNQRFKCSRCCKRYSLPKGKLLGAMTLAESKALMCLNPLVEGNSIRSTERITGVHRDTVLRLLETVGRKCIWIQENLVKKVKVSNVQADEIWSYVAMKDKTKNEKSIEDEKIGSAYTFTAIEVESKLIIAWHLGRRTEQDAAIFLEKVAGAIEGATKRFQMTTDAFPGYTHTVREILGMMADYGQLHKSYRADQKDESRYSPADCIGTSKKVIVGRPDESKISTSIVERHNLTMRMSMRRFTRLTNGFSKKWENLNYMLAIFFVFYNFCRMHKSLRCTPAMAAGITNHVWELHELLTVRD